MVIAIFHQGHLKLHFASCFSILTLIPLGYFEDLSPLGGGGAVLAPPPQISATNGPIDSKIGTVVKQVK